MACRTEFQVARVQVLLEFKLEGFGVQGLRVTYYYYLLKYPQHTPNVLPCKGNIGIIILCFWGL